jgi:hypothetical protein
VENCGVVAGSHDRDRRIRKPRKDPPQNRHLAERTESVGVVGVTAVRGILVRVSHAAKLA